jgi:hypothetical protein
MAPVAPSPAHELLVGLLAELRRPPGRLLIAQIVAGLRWTGERIDEDPVAMSQR